MNEIISHWTRCSQNSVSRYNKLPITVCGTEIISIFFTPAIYYTIWQISSNKVCKNLKSSPDQTQKNQFYPLHMLCYLIKHRPLSSSWSSQSVNCIRYLGPSSLYNLRSHQQKSAQYLTQNLKMAFSNTLWIIGFNDTADSPLRSVITVC